MHRIMAKSTVAVTGNLFVWMSIHVSNFGDQTNWQLNFLVQVPAGTVTKKLISGPVNKIWTFQVHISIS